MSAGSESIADRLIAEAMKSGEFDRLPGEGKPIPGAGQRDDPLWWVRAWVRRNRAETPDDDSWVPPRVRDSP